MISKAAQKNLRSLKKEPGDKLFTPYGLSTVGGESRHIVCYTGNESNPDYLLRSIMGYTRSLKN